MKYIEQATRAGATDLHLTEDGQAVMRCLGQMKVLGSCSSEDFLQTEKILMANTFILKNDLEKVKDFSVSIPAVGRLRCRRYCAQGKRSLAIRFLPSKIPSPQALQWPSALYQLCELQQGLVLVTGATGSGKSTTLAAMIESINARRACHIITLESPVEYEFSAKQALVHQCEVPSDMSSFSDGATSLLRMDPDVIMIGELNNQETMRAVLKLAESGHLVFATMHTASTVDAVEYFVNHFEAAEQQVIRYQLANVLRAVVAQRLLVHSSENRRLAAYEILLRNTAVVQQIKANDLTQLQHTLESGHSEGMVILEADLARMVKNGTVRMEEALRACNDANRLRKYLQR